MALLSNTKGLVLLHLLILTIWKKVFNKPFLSTVCEVEFSKHRADNLNAIVATKLNLGRVFIRYLALTKNHTFAWTKSY